MTKYWIAWNDGKTEGSIFSTKPDAESALDGEHWCDPAVGFSCISTLAEAFFDAYGEQDCFIEEVSL